MNNRKLIKSLGPGIMFASTAIGVSHLVQCTRAGADYGFTFLWAILVANVLKYPFFEFGSRYANSTGKSLLHGYKDKGIGWLWLYFGLSLVSMLIVTAAVTFVTAGLFSNLFHLDWNVSYVALGLLLVCGAILISGGFRMLDSLLKIIGVVMLLSTIGAFAMAMIHGPINQAVDFMPKEAYSVKGQLFMIALMGWMPTAVDLSTWNSIWTVEKIKTSQEPVSMKETLFDFNFGYWVSAILSICFLTLGAFLMYGSEDELSNKAPVFAGQVVNLFTSALGSWSYPIIAASAFSVMFSTTITVIDGYSRAMTETISLLFSKKIRAYGYWLVAIIIGTFLVIGMYLSELKKLVDIATILSFVIAPIIAILNFSVINSDEVKDEHKPGLALKVLSYLGIIFLLFFTFYFIKLYFIDG